MRRIMMAINIIIMLVFTGCWDKNELEELGYVAAIGVDLREDRRMVVTYQIQNPQVGSSVRAEAQNEKESSIITLDAADILSARETSGANISRKIDFSQANILILGEEFAKSETCFENLSELLREREIKSDISIVVCREKAAEFIRNNRPSLETRPMKFYDLMARRWKETGLAPPADLHMLTQKTERDKGLFLAIYATAKESYKKELREEDQYLPGEVPLKSTNPTQIIGSAVFKEGKMFSNLTGEETRIVLNLRPEARFSGINVTYKDPLDEKYRISARLYKVKSPQLKIDISDEKPKIDVKLELEIRITNIPSHIDYVEDLEKQKVLKRSIEEDIKEETNSLIEKTQRELKAEPFNWRPIAASKFWTYEDLKKYDWMGKYSEAEINFDVEVKLKDFGKELKPSSLERIRD
jgi:spore germination protein KC